MYRSFRIKLEMGKYAETTVYIFTPNVRKLSVFVFSSSQISHLTSSAIGPSSVSPEAHFQWEAGLFNIVTITKRHLHSRFRGEPHSRFLARSQLGARGFHNGKLRWLLLTQRALEYTISVEIIRRRNERKNRINKIINSITSSRCRACFKCRAF